MKADITIQIHGQRASGKSTLAVFLHRLINKSNTRYYVEQNPIDDETVMKLYGEIRDSLITSEIEPRRVKITVCPSCSHDGKCQEGK